MVHAVWTGNTATGQQIIYDNYAGPRRLEAPLVTKDDGAWGFMVTGAGWVNDTSAGFLGDQRVHAFGGPASAGNVARYFITRPGGPGLSELFITWAANVVNTAAATVRIFDGTTLRGICAVNQRDAATGIQIGATLAQSLGIYTTTTGVFRVEISSQNFAAHMGRIVADGIFDPPILLASGEGQVATSETNALFALLDEPVPFDSNVPAPAYSANGDAEAPSPGFWGQATNPRFDDAFALAEVRVEETLWAARGKRRSAATLDPLLDPFELED